VSVVRFTGVAKRFDGEAHGYAVQGLDLNVEHGELVAVVGRTGCGKSTMFNLLIGLIGPTAGRIEVLGRDPFGDFHALAGKLSFVFQNDRLLPWRSALDNVAYGLELRHVPRQRRLAVGRDWLSRLGLEAHQDKYPPALSGGMRQRISIARAFAIDPELLLCDEPFSALDELTGAELRNELRRLVRDTHKTGVFVTHSISEAIAIGDRILVFRAPGHVAAEFHTQDALRELGEDLLKRKILEVMADHAGAAEAAAITQETR